MGNRPKRLGAIDGSERTSSALQRSRASGVRLLAWRVERLRRERQARRHQQHPSGDRRLRSPRALRHGPRVQRRELQHLRRTTKGLAPDVGRLRGPSPAPRRRSPGRKDDPRRSDDRIGPEITKHRITWSANPDGSVRQLWESTGPNGEWTVAFDGKYTRKVTSQVGRPRPGTYGLARRKRHRGHTRDNANQADPRRRRKRFAQEQRRLSRLRWELEDTPARSCPPAPASE